MCGIKKNTHASVGSSSCYFCANTVGSSPKNHMTEQWENKRQRKAPATRLRGRTCKQPENAMQRILQMHNKI